jgi:hypothetical protein
MSRLQSSTSLRNLIWFLREGGMTDTAVAPLGLVWEHHFSKGFLFSQGKMN